MSDIVERLRAGEPCEEEGGCACQVEKRNAASGCLCAVAADTITALRAENERLREFVLFVDKWTNYKPNKPEKPTSYEDCVKTIAPMAREFARAALEEKP